MDIAVRPAAPLVRLRLIGQMDAWTLASENVLPTGRKARAIMAILALSGLRPVLRSTLTERLWSRRSEVQARASLRQEIHRLLMSLQPAGAPVLAVSRDHLMLRPELVWIDVQEVLRATPASPGALALLDGELLEDLDDVDPAFDTWLSIERERLRDRARGLAAELLRRASDPQDIAAAAQQLLAIDRTQEDAWRALMQVHAARGERGLAIEAFERCRATLADRLDVAPSAETLRLFAQIRAARAAAVSIPAPRPLGRTTACHAVAQPAPAARARDGTCTALRRGGARIGVLPLLPIGTAGAETYLATGLAEEITTALARFRWMFVASSAFLARISMETRDPMAIRLACGIDFLLDGTIHRIGARLRINLRLLDLKAGQIVVWSQRFDRDTGDLPNLQDEIAAQVVARIDPELLLIEARHVVARAAIDADAYDLVLRALPLINQLDRTGYLEAGALLRRAIAIEPDSAIAHTWLAFWHLFLVGQGWSTDRAETMREANHLAERAIRLDPQDARALAIAGHVCAFLEHRMGEAMSLYDRAIATNPNLAMAWAMSAITCTYLGDLDEADRRVRRYKQLSPLDPHAFFYDSIMAYIAVFRGDDATAASIGRAVSAMNLAFSSGLKPYLAALGHLGDQTDAPRVLRRLLDIEPDFTIGGFAANAPFQNAGHLTRMVDGLRLAGVPNG